MPAGPIGSKWATGSWSDTCWEVGTWSSGAPTDVPGGGGQGGYLAWQASVIACSLLLMATISYATFILFQEAR